MSQLIRGANAPIASGHCEVVLEWPTASGALDTSAFLLTAAGTVRTDADFVFYNQPESPEGSVRQDGATIGTSRFVVDLPDVPREIERVVLCVTLEAHDRRTLASFDGLVASLRDGSTRLRYEPELQGAHEAALRLVELYRRQDGWKVRAVGQGFDGGLAPLARGFGVDVADEEAEAPTAPAPTAYPLVAPSPPPSMPVVPPDEFARPSAEIMEFDVPPPDAVRPRTIDPDRDGAKSLGMGQGVSLAPAAPGEGVIGLALGWSSRQGGADGRVRPLVPRLGAFYELADGRRGVVQIPERPRMADGEDLLSIALEKRGGTCRQRLAIPAARVGEIERLDVYVHLEGAPSWRASEVYLMVIVPGIPPRSMTLPEIEDGIGAVAIATLRRSTDRDQLTCRMLTGRDQLDLDRELGWNLDWKPAAD